MISLYSLDADAFHPNHLRTLLAISPKAGLVMENALRLRDAGAVAITDELTGLPNAGSLFRHLRDEISRCEAAESSIGVLILDVDGLKGANNRYGHLAGDRVLQGVAKGLRGCCREADYLARFGGDEFVMVLQRTEEHVLASVMQRIDALAHEVGVRIYGKDTIRISSGSAAYPRDAGEVDALLEQARRRMEDMKKTRSLQLCRTA